MATMSRHGLIAGATGTGKTRTLQLIAEQLSDAGVAVFAADYKGDLSGLTDAGAPDGLAPKRMADLGLPYQPAAYPVEFLSLGGLASQTIHVLLRALVQLEDGGVREGGPDACRPHALACPTVEQDRVAGVGQVAKASPLSAKYGTRLERDSALEELANRVDATPDEPAAPKGKPAKPAGNALTDFLGSRQGKALQREVVRGAFSLLRKRM